MRSVSRSGSSSAASGRMDVPLVNCPHCRVPVIRITSKKKETYGEVFFKCPNNVKDDPTTCGWIRSEQQYVHALAKAADEVREEVRHGDVNSKLKVELSDMKLQMEEFKHQFDSAVTEIWKMKVQMAELKHQLSVRHDSALVCAICVSLLVGFVVSKMM
ncbi:hypothetical protein U9M48_017366 [Paspalum notatum var. saurae]|uniref:Zinc finger GRF-type domain-containing protein n=1 Tax=Paspalum notatum var. saurae TaxID=547442 RepID=A0AAQ3T7B7_PASNO